jgi:hypothetical protein
LEKFEWTKTKMLKVEQKFYAKFDQRIKTKDYGIKNNNNNNSKT